jgi:DNA-binding transcriptional LysR family regulator
MDGRGVDELELRHLRVLVALAREGTFTDAAIDLGLSQPDVSRSLARLEQLVGVELVARTTRSLELTPAGQAAVVAAVAGSRRRRLLRRRGSRLALPAPLGIHVGSIRPTH